MVKLITIFVLFYLNVYAISLKDSVSEVVSKHPKILEKQKEYDMILLDLELANTKYKPKIDFKIAKGYEKSNTKSTNNKDISLNPITKNLTLTQNLFDGFYTTNTVKIKKAKLNAFKYSYDDLINNIVSEYILSYLEILKNRELLAIEKENVSIHEKIYSDIKVQLENGTGRTSNLKDIGAKLALSYANYLSQTNTLNDALANFHKYFGRYEKVETFENIDINISIPTALDTLLQKVLETNPAILTQVNELESLKLEFAASKSTYYPKIDFEASKESSTDTAGIKGENDTSKAMINLSYTLYNGGYDSTTVIQNTAAIHKKIRL